VDTRKLLLELPVRKRGSRLSEGGRKEAALKEGKQQIFASVARLDSGSEAIDANQDNREKEKNRLSSTGSEVQVELLTFSIHQGKPHATKDLSRAGVRC